MHAKFTLDSNIEDVQKVHEIPVPRIGGVSVYAGFMGAIFLKSYFVQFPNNVGLTLLFSAIPVFVIGLVEDITKVVSIRLRFVSVFISTILAGYFLNAWLTNYGFDWASGIVSQNFILIIILTVFSVTGLTNSFNIIDGCNGLSSGVAIFILFGIFYVALTVGDYEIQSSSLILAGAVLGFFAWNYPFGKLFLGDSGAYFIGFLVAELSILLVVRNPQVSPWFPFLLCAYPITETLFTIYRRVIVKGSYATKPDASHLHQLIYRRVVRTPISSADLSHSLLRNSLTTPYLWLLSIFSIVPGILFWKNQLILQICSIIFIYLYIWLYKAIVRYRFPAYLITRMRSR